MEKRRASTVGKGASNEELKEKCDLFRTKFYSSLVADPIAIPPDLKDNENYTPEEDGEQHDVENIDEILTKREQDYFNQAQLYCHLRARQWNLQKSLDMIRETLRWRREAKPWTISCDDVEHHFRTGKNYHRGWTKDHRPCVVMRVRLDQPGDDEGKIKTMLYQMERSMRLIKARKKSTDDWKANVPATLLDTPPYEQVAWIFDCRRFAKKDFNLTLSKELARVLDHYPEKLGVVFLVDTPLLFRTFWKVAKGMVDEKTQRKVVFVTGEDGRKKSFPLHFESDQYEICFCGASKYNYDHAKYYKLLRREERKGITVLKEAKGCNIPIDQQTPTPLDDGEEEEELVNPDEPTPQEERKKKDK